MSTLDRVVAFAAKDAVTRAACADKHIISAQAAECVYALTAEYRVIAVGAFQHVILQSSWSWNLNGMFQVAPDRPWGFNVAANLHGREGYPLP